MKSYKDWKLGSKILSGFLIVVVIAGIIGGVGIFSLLRVNSSYNVAYTDSVEALENTEIISAGFQRIRMNLYGFVLAESSADKEYYLSRIDDFKIEIDTAIANYRQMLAGYKAEEVVQEITMIDQVQENLINFGAVRNELIEGPGADPARQTEAYEWLKDGGQLRQLALLVDNSLEDLIRYNTNYAQDQIASNGALATASAIIIIVCVAIGIILAILIALYISRGISNKVAILVQASNRLALGDVNVNVDSDTKDEIGVLMDSFAMMIENTREQARLAERIAGGDLTVDVKIRSEFDLLGQKLHELVENNNEIMTNIVAASDQVLAGSDQVAAGAQALSQGATEQASSVEELTATITDVAQQLQKNALSALEARNLSEEAGQEVVSSNQQMQKLMAAMQEINQTSQEIGKIIKTIEDIAFQTNILALNAAVEAARAGSAGKGFAVVADEVRNLAAKSAEAANNTTDLIRSTLNAIETGSKLSDVTAESLSNVAQKAATVDTRVAEIAQALERESAAIEQIATGVNQISAVVQTNSATSEESAAASEQLAGQAALLKDQISRFRLKNGNQNSWLKDSGLAKAVPTREQQTSQEEIVLTGGSFGKY